MNSEHPQSPAEQQRNIEPSSLAEHLAAHGGVCPIPHTHDRLHETHHWWHQMAHWYHEPQEFRYALGAFIQAARSVTFMLQKEQKVFTDFAWYDAWVEQAKADLLLKWLKDTRSDFVHAQALEPFSWLKMQCITDPPPAIIWDDEEPPYYSVSPFQCTHHYMAHGPKTDHAHEFERYWGIENLPGRELLESCAEIYDQMDALVLDAHKRLGAHMPSHRTPTSRRALPCMENTLRHRVVRTVIKDGQEVWNGEPSGLHSHG